VQLMTRRRAAAALAMGAGLTLTACGVGGASHVVRGTASSPGSSVSTPATTPTGATASSPTASPTAPATPLNSQTLSQIDTELAPVDSGLSQANTDIDNPQGDS